MTNKTPLWLDEFGPAYAVPSEIADVLEDLSFGNDVCPSFTTRVLAQNDPDYHAGVDVRLWADHPDPQQRETGPDTPRFRVSHFFGETEFVYETETDIAEALAVLRREAAKYTQPANERRLARVMCQRCESAIEADGGCKCATVTVATLRDLISRTLSVMDVQLSDNGEPFREGNEELYAELQALVSLCDMTAGELTLPRK